MACVRVTAITRGDNGLGTYAPIVESAVGRALLP